MQTNLGDGNESTKVDFITDIVKAIIKEYKLYETLHYNKERDVSGQETQGRVEFVFSANATEDLPIVLLIEAKKDDFSQGRAKCYLELFTAGQMNIEHDEKYDFPLYGITTNSLFWMFVRYDLKLYDENLKEQTQVLFTESDAISIGKDQELKAMLQVLVGILKEQEKKMIWKSRNKSFFLPFQ
jgi:hypothetical protein